MFRTKRRSAAAALVLLLGLAAAAADVKGVTITGGNYEDLSTYPGIKKFNYAVTPVREDISEEAMVDPEYTFRISDKTVDEYFGTTGELTKNGKTYKGVYLSQNNKGKCGVRYHKLFRYQDDWIDVKTTYVDWSVSDETRAFVSGGFCGMYWTCVNYTRLRHEFYRAGTDTPVEIKGFFTYTDIDDSQGMGLIPSEIRSLWMNQNGTDIKYKITEEGYLFMQDSTGHPVDASMGAEKTARAVFSYTFEGSRHDQFILYGKTNTSMNSIRFEASKKIPSGIPQEGSALIRKQVSVDGGDFGENNTLRSWNAEWQYRIAAPVPLETEEGNLLDGFSITDDIDQCLDISGVKILRGAGADVTDMFDLSINGNRIEAKSVNTHDAEFTGYTYYMLVDVKVSAPEERIRAHGHFMDGYTALFKNKAAVSYTDGSGRYERSTNEAETEVVFPYKADITITKKMKISDIHWDHGVPSFIIHLSGVVKGTDDEVEYNKVITFTKEYVEKHESETGYVTGSVVFNDVYEGIYSCDEKKTLRYALCKITDIKGGSAGDGCVRFEVNDTSPRKATFINARASWNDYSDSRCVVNRFGL